MKSHILYNTIHSLYKGANMSEWFKRKTRNLAAILSFIMKSHVLHNTYISGSGILLLPQRVVPENCRNWSLGCQYVRVVKETDLKSVGLCLRRFESCYWREKLNFWGVNMSEWLRRQTRDLLGYAYVGLNPAIDSKFVGLCLRRFESCYWRIFSFIVKTHIGWTRNESFFI